MSLEKEQLITMYTKLCGSRMAEEAITSLAKEGVTGGHHSVTSKNLWRVGLKRDSLARVEDAGAADGAELFGYR